MYSMVTLLTVYVNYSSHLPPKKEDEKEKREVSSVLEKGSQKQDSLKGAGLAETNSECLAPGEARTG